MTNFRCWWRSVLMLLVILTVCAITGLGQASLMSGTIVDPNGNAVAGATVAVTSTMTGVVRTTTTRSDGAYQIAQLAPGVYRVRAEAQGFKAVIQEEVQVQVNTPLTLNITFNEIGAVSEAVTVQGGESTINTADATIGKPSAVTKRARR